MVGETLTHPLQICNTVKLREPPKACTTAAHRKVECQHQGNDLGDGKSVQDAPMDNPQPSPKFWG
jgi:hypothetical protein